jgi:hypothetical protein
MLLTIIAAAYSLSKTYSRKRVEESKSEDAPPAEEVKS